MINIKYLLFACLIKNIFFKSKMFNSSILKDVNKIIFFNNDIDLIYKIILAKKENMHFLSKGYVFL